MPGWLRGKSQEEQLKNIETPHLSQTEATLTPNLNNDVPPTRNVSDSVLKLPPLMQSDAAHISKSQISMKTIFVPGVAINSVKFNDNGQRLAYSTEAGVIQVYEFMDTVAVDENGENGDDKVSPKLLHTFCVSKPNEIVSICWDSQNENRLFIAIGNRKKKDDHIQIWNVGEKKCEHLIAFGDVRIESMECSQNAKNRLIVSGTNESKQSVLYLYDECNESKNEWKLISKSNAMSAVITCIEFNHNGKILIIGDKEGKIRIFDVKNGYFTELSSFNAHNGAIQSIHLCDDANSILSIAQDFIVKHWQIMNDSDSCKKIWKLAENQSDANKNILPLLCLGPNNFFAVTQSETTKNENGPNEEHKEGEFLYNVMIKNLNSEEMNGSDVDIVIGGHSKVITAIDWHKDSQMIATCSVDDLARLSSIHSKLKKSFT